MARPADNRRGTPGLGVRLAVVFAGAALVAIAIFVVSGLGGGGSPHQTAADRDARARAAADLTRPAAPTGPPPEGVVALVERPTDLRATPAGRKIGRIGTQTEFRSARVLAIVDRRGNWLRVVASELPNGKTAWIDAGATRQFPIEYRITAHLSARRIDVVRSGKVVRRIRAAVGEQGTPTPLGTFAVTDKVPFVDPGSAYGCCAIALSAHQPNRPSTWQGGDRIAIHATPHASSIGQPVTLGCMRIPVADARWLMANLPLGTLVTIRA
jgi:lipoprotein-anchoring transpeptidase ErfK/SrfK